MEDPLKREYKHRCQALNCKLNSMKNEKISHTTDAKQRVQVPILMKWNMHALLVTNIDQLTLIHELTQIWVSHLSYKFPTSAFNYQEAAVGWWK